MFVGSVMTRACAKRCIVFAGVGSGGKWFHNYYTSPTLTSLVKGMCRMSSGSSSLRRGSPSRVSLWSLLVPGGWKKKRKRKKKKRKKNDGEVGTLVRERGEGKKKKK